MAAKRFDLTARRHPEAKNPPTGEVRLWWAVIRQAALDVLRGPDYMAREALVFLVLAGLPFLEEEFTCPKRMVLAEVVRLARQRWPTAPPSSLSSQ